MSEDLSGPQPNFMPRRYAERKGWTFRVVDEQSADVGIKSVEVEIVGEYSYGMLAPEKGTHRLVRISPYNAQAKRQTSFAAVEVCFPLAHHTWGDLWDMGAFQRESGPPYPPHVPSLDSEAYL